MNEKCTHPELMKQSEGKRSGICALCGMYQLAKREHPAYGGGPAVAALPVRFAEREPERLPNDAYAAQGGKAAVNELLNLKMRQVVNLHEKIHEIRELIEGYRDLGSNCNTANLSGGALESYEAAVSEGRRQMAELMFPILDRNDNP